MSIPRTLRHGAVLGSMLLLGAGAAALAAHPLKGKTYSGSVNGQYGGPVSFQVSGNGQRVKKLTVPAVRNCTGGPVSLAPKPTTASITSTGKFKTTVNLYFEGPSSVGTETITGTFRKAGAETGTLTSHYNGYAKHCDTTSAYATHA
ncbi:MAG TPA: hypothetical protein VE983_12160 [Solirubrobacteraceae bacterium]|nr:hypothetical protein [Solirubrobacteraceae bacterium]